MLLKYLGVKSVNNYISMIAENPKVTQTAMAERLNITSRAVKKNIKELGEISTWELRKGNAQFIWWNGDAKWNRK